MQDFLKEIRYPIIALFLLTLLTSATLAERARLNQADQICLRFKEAIIQHKATPAIEVLNAFNHCNEGVRLSNSHDNGWLFAIFGNANCGEGVPTKTERAE
jgi:hypothetical protein